jgi:hypothetical protein
MNASRTVLLSLCLGSCAAPRVVTSSPKPPAPHASTPAPTTATLEEQAVRQRAMKDLECDDVVVRPSEGATSALRPFRTRQTYLATGCARSAPFVVVCTEDVDGGGGCKAMPVEADHAAAAPYWD